MAQKADNQNKRERLLKEQKDEERKRKEEKRKGPQGLKLSITHVQKYQLDQELLAPVDMGDEQLLAPRSRSQKKKSKSKKKVLDKEQLMVKYPGYNSDDIEFLEQDFGGDDSEAKFNYSLTGSDIEMNPISDDGDNNNKMRHIE